MKGNWQTIFSWLALETESDSFEQERVGRLQIQLKRTIRIEIEAEMIGSSGLEGLRLWDFECCIPNHRWLIVGVGDSAAY
jgi:hypothetical protein